MQVSCDTALVREATLLITYIFVLVEWILVFRPHRVRQSAVVVVDSIVLAWSWVIEVELSLESLSFVMGEGESFVFYFACHEDACILV